MSTAYGGRRQSRNHVSLSSEKEIGMAKKHLAKYSAPFSIRKMQMKTALTFYLTPQPLPLSE